MAGKSGAVIKGLFFGSPVRLSPEKHEGFWQDQQALIRERTGIILFLGCVFFPFFFVSDLAYYPEKKEILFFVRVSTGLVCLVLFWLNRKLDLGRRSFWLGLLGFYACALGMIAIILITDGYRTSYYAGFLMVVVAFSSLMALPARIIAPHIVAMYFLYVFLLLVQHAPEKVSLFLVSHLLMLTGIGICLVVTEASHRLRVRDYLSRLALEEAKERLKRQARELAARVSESRSRYRHLVERMNDCLGVSGPGGEIVYVNDRFCELVGCDREDLLGYSFLELVEEEIRDTVALEFEKRKRGIRSAYETRLLHHSGKRIPVIVSSEALLDEKGSFLGSFAVITDISHQKKMEEALLATSKRLRGILDATIDAVILLDSEGRILDSNASAARELGEEVADLRGETVENFWLPQVSARRIPMIRLVFEGGKGLSFEEMFETRTFVHHVYPIMGEDSRVTAVALYSRDVTDLKSAERRIAHLTHELLRALEKERHRIARDLHDHVAQDLSSLRISFEDLALALENQPDMRHRASLISRRLQETIKDLREIAYDLRPPDLDNLGLAHTLYRYCHEFSEYSGIPVHFVSGGMDTVVRDADREINIYRLVQEALSNIRKHSGATQVDVRLIASHPDIIVRISDNGIGFDAESWDGPASSERGMGLKGMAERVALLGGRFEIRSNPGEGCRIAVWIPMGESLIPAEDPDFWTASRQIVP